MRENPENTPKSHVVNGQQTFFNPVSLSLHSEPVPTSKPAKPAPNSDLPGWLRKELETRTGGFRHASWNRCPRCRAIILEGLDDDIAAFTVQADPTPINIDQENICHTIGRHTYTATIGKNIELNHRTTYAAGRPSRHPIVPAHRCGARFAGFLLPQLPTERQAHHDRPAPF